MRQANTELRTIAQEYNNILALAPIVEGHYVPVDEALATEIANYYPSLPTIDPSASLAYSHLAIELLAQYRLLVSHGYTFEAWQQEGQPYANSNEMCDDVRTNKHLYFFQGGDVHPFLGGQALDNGWSYNDVFRAVHDVFGHAAEGYQFGPRGEENAWIHHSMMFTPLAQRALTTETRGQNAWVNYGPFKHLPASERPYAEQKSALLPLQYSNYREALAR